MIEGLLQGRGEVIHIDDILVTGSSEEAHLEALDEVLSQLDRAGLRVKQSKCEFLRPPVTYLGHRTNADNLYLLPDWVQAIEDA